MAVIVNGMFGIKIPYNEKVITAFRKDIPGRRWDVANKVWWMPVSDIYKIADILKPAFPSVANRLLTSPRFEDVRGIIEKSKKAVEASFATDAAIDIPVPENLEYLGYQKAGIAFALGCYTRNPTKGVLIADEMGLGKTIQAIGFFNALREKLNRQLRILVVCPASLKYNWQRECYKWMVKKCPMLVMESGVPAAYMARHPLVIINYDIMKKYAADIYAIEWDVIVYDESHYLKNKGTQRSMACRVIGHMPSAFVVELSGTPLLNRPAELWHQLHIIDPQQWASSLEFENRYCAGGKLVGKGASNLGELQQILRSTLMIRRMKNDVLKELPPKMRQVVEVGKKGYEQVLKKNEALLGKLEEYQQQLDKLENELGRTAEEAARVRYEQKIKELKSGQVGSLGEIARVRHETALAKVPEVIKFVDNILEQKNKVVVFAHHRDVIDCIHKKYKKNSVVLYGGMSSEDKDKSVQAFKTKDNINIIIVSIAAGGVGLTLTEADTVVFAELDWTPAQNQQCEDRLHRIGQENVVFVYHVVLEGSIDANIAKKCIAKQAVIDEAINK